MVKKSLKEYLHHNDYSYLKIEQKRRIAPLHELIDDKNELRILESGMALNRILQMPVSEYFRYLETHLDKLFDMLIFSGMDFKNEAECEFLTVSDVIAHICSVKEDFSSTYSVKDFYGEISNILLQPIIDSGYNHELFSHLLIYIYRFVYSNTGYEEFEPEMLRKELQYESMNSICRKLYDKDPAACSFALFNYVIRPAYALIKDEI